MGSERITTVFLKTTPLTYNTTFVDDDVESKALMFQGESDLCEKTPICLYLISGLCVEIYCFTPFLRTLFNFGMGLVFVLGLGFVVVYCSVIIIYTI